MCLRVVLAASMRVLMRGRAECLADSACVAEEGAGALAAFDRMLLMLLEHTWGMDVKVSLLQSLCVGCVCAFDVVCVHVAVGAFL